MQDLRKINKFVKKEKKSINLLKKERKHPVDRVAKELRTAMINFQRLF